MSFVVLTGCKSSSNSQHTDGHTTCESSRTHEDMVSLGSDDSGILSEGGSGTRESSVEQLTSIDVSRESLNSEGAKSSDVEMACEPTTPCIQVSSDGTEPQQSANKGFLLRLLECKLFDMSMAISYLFNR